MDYHAFANCVELSAKWGCLSEFAVTHYPSIGRKFAPKQQVQLFSSERSFFDSQGAILWDAGGTFLSGLSTSVYQDGFYLLKANSKVCLALPEILSVTPNPCSCRGLKNLRSRFF